MIWLILLQFSIQAHAKIHYHKDKDVRPILEIASVIRNHSLQVQTRNVLAQIYTRLDAREIEAMRSKAISLVKSLPERKYNDIENETESELLFFYLEAVKNIPGAEVISTYTPKLKPIPRKDFWGQEIPVTEPISVTDNQSAKNFRVHGSSIDFIIDNKVYRIRPGLFGRTSMHLLSSDAKKYQLAEKKCFDNKEELSEREQKTKCEDFRNLTKVEYRIRNKNFKIDSEEMEFFVTPAFNHTGSGSTRLADDRVSNSAFTAAYLNSDLQTTEYINGNQVEYEFSDEQEAMIDAIQKETTAPTNAATTSSPAATGSK